MKRMLGWWAALMWLGMAGSGLADGFIIIHPRPPGPGPVPVPPIWPGPPPRPWPRPHPFAPLEVVFHQVQVRIQDQVAVTKVEQEFYNPNDQSLEGTYLFPVPPGAQLDRFSLQIGGREVEAELLAADKARKIYEDIVRQQRDPALLEYAGRDAFKVRIFPIEPHSRKHITLAYSQVLKADTGLMTYMYPLNTEKFSAKPLRKVSLQVSLEGRRPLKTVYSPSHTVEVRRQGDRTATVKFEAQDVRPDTDFQLLFAFDSDPVGISLLTHRERGQDGYYLLLAAPGVDVRDQPVLAKDVVFVVDTSGSMAGAKLSQAKKALTFCVENLNAQDRFEILRFSTEVEPLFQSLAEATPARRERAQQFVGEFRPLGGTAIDAALQAALDRRPAQSSRPFVIIFLTDGLPTLGVTEEDPIVANVKRRLASGPAAEQGGRPRVFCFGIGTEVNTHLLDRITEASHAFSQYVLPEEDLELKLSNFYTKIKSPVLTQLRLAWPEGVRVIQGYPDALPDLYQGEQLLLAGRFKGAGRGTLRLEGSVNGRLQTFAAPVEFPEAEAGHEFIPRLWATRRVGFLLDEIRLHGENAELRDEVTDLARRYGIVTPYTAYLIVEDEARRNVPLLTRSFQAFDQDLNARREGSVALDRFKADRSGSVAVAGARGGLAMKSAMSPADAIQQGAREAQRGWAASAPGTSSATAGRDVSGSGPAPSRIEEYTQQTRFQGGRNFFQNGMQWIEAGVQKLPHAQRIRIQFGSAEYFELVTRHPSVRPWLALGQNVQFVWDGAVYEVYE